MRSSICCTSLIVSFGLLHAQAIHAQAQAEVSASSQSPSHNSLPRKSVANSEKVPLKGSFAKGSYGGNSEDLARDLLERDTQRLALAMSGEAPPAGFIVVQSPSTKKIYRAETNGYSEIAENKGIGMDGALPGFKPQGAYESAISKVASESKGKVNEELGAALAVEYKKNLEAKAENAGSSRFPQQEPDKDTLPNVTPISPLLSQSLNYITYSTAGSQDPASSPASSPEIPSSQQEEVNRYVSAARDNIGYNELNYGSDVSSMLRAAAHEGQESIGAQFQDIRSKDLNKSLPSSYVAPLMNLVANPEFQNIASKQIGINRLSNFNQASVAASLAARPGVKAEDLKNTAAAYSLATSSAQFSNPIETSNSTDVSKTDPKDGVMPSFPGSSWGPSSSAKDSATLLSSYAAGNFGGTLPPEAKEWIEVAKNLSTPGNTVFDRLNDSDKKRFATAYVRLLSWLQDLRNYRGLDLLRDVGVDMKPNPELEAWAIQNAKASLGVASKMISRDPKYSVQESYKAFRSFYDEKRVAFDTSLRSEDRLEVLKSSLLDDTKRAMWRSQDRNSYFLLRRSTAVLSYTTKAADLASFRPKDSDLKELIVRSLGLVEARELRSSNQRRDRRKDLGPRRDASGVEARNIVPIDQE